MSNKSQSSRGSTRSGKKQRHIHKVLEEPIIVEKPKFEPLYNIGDIVQIKESGDLGIVVRITLLGNNLINKVIVKVNNITNLYTYDEISAVNM